jgi:hypothetical protein
MFMIANSLFYCKNKDTYPPFKKGLYLEEYFLKYISELPSSLTLKRTYIPALWTNFQIENWFNSKKNEMQMALDKWVAEHPSPNGYFTVVQYDDGSLLTLPQNTIVYGACSGNIPIPLIYEDENHTLERMQHKSFADKSILCSFVGNITANKVTPNVRAEMFRQLSNRSEFVMINSGGWTASVGKPLQDVFTRTTIDSKFALAPRGYGRASFRFFEIFQLRTIPVYIWNDMNWLPFQSKIDYSKLCVVIHVSELNQLPNKLASITEEEYNRMFEYYDEVKHLFTLEGMTVQIIEEMK